jgi:Uma2 family endonuclease
MSYKEYTALPEGRYELIEGEFIVTPSATPRHQLLVGALHFALLGFVRAHRLGQVFQAPLDVLLREPDPALVVQPDLPFVPREGAARVAERNVVGPPALVVEALSPSNAKHDAVRKRALYEAHGVQEYWMVLPDLEQIEVLRLNEDRRFERPQLLEAPDILTTPLLPGFELPLAELFASDDD